MAKTADGCGISVTVLLVTHHQAAHGREPSPGNTPAQVFWAGFWAGSGPMLPTEFVDGRGLADDGSGPASPPNPPSPPHPPCLPDWATTPEMPCLGPTPTSFEKFSGDDSTTILAFAVMGLVGVIGLTAFARERSRELHQGNPPAPRLEVVDVGPGAALWGSQRGAEWAGLCVARRPHPVVMRAF